MKCPDCGHENAADARFCSSCGSDQLVPVRCPFCNTAMKSGYLVPISPGYPSGYQLWFDTYPNYILYAGQGEQLTNPPLFGGDAYSATKAFRCKACKAVVFRY